LGDGVACNGHYLRPTARRDRSCGLAIDPVGPVPATARSTNRCGWAIARRSARQATSRHVATIARRVDAQGHHSKTPTMAHDPCDAHDWVVGTGRSWARNGPRSIEDRRVNSVDRTPGAATFGR